MLYKDEQNGKPSTGWNVYAEVIFESVNIYGQQLRIQLQITNNLNAPNVAQCIPT